MGKQYWVAAFLFFAMQAVNGLDIGGLAPDFVATDSHGHKHSLAEYQGQYVVLEWNNRECPYVQKYYESGAMQQLQRHWTSKGVVWLTVISSAPGKPGYVTPRDENGYLRRIGAAPTAVLLDPAGELGHLYEAQTTPEIFVISPGGKLIYQGAIDNSPSVEIEDISGALNYVDQALQQSLAGQHVTTPQTRSYGYMIKYAD